jgi:hypothetical protein
MQSLAPAAQFGIINRLHDQPRAVAKEHRMKSESTEYHPTATSVALVFLDILFGVLLGIIVLEYPVKDFPGKGWFLLPFQALYFALLLKFFFHWWGLHHDIAVLSQFLGLRVNLGNYLAGLLTAFTYFVCIRLSAIWLSDPHRTFELSAALFILGVYKVIGDIVVNNTMIPALIRRLFANFQTPNEAQCLLKAWYCDDQPRKVRLWLVSGPALIAAPFVGLRSLFVVLAVYLILESIVEVLLFRARLALWERLTAFVESQQHAGRG